MGGEFKRSLACSLSILFLVTSGFAETLEIEHGIHGRQTMNFYGSKNVEFLLGAGTRGTVLKKNHFRSGNVAYQITIQNGPHKGATTWVLGFKGKKDLQLLTDKNKPAASPQEAQALKTLRQVPGLKKPLEPSAPTEQAHLGGVVDGIARVFRDVTHLSENRELNCQTPDAAPPRLIAAEDDSSSDGSLEGSVIQKVLAYRTAAGTQIPPRAVKDLFKALDQYRGRTHTFYRREPVFEPGQALSDGIGAHTETNVPVIGNQRYAFIMDEDKSSSKPRFFKIDLLTGDVQSTLAGNGYGSDCNDGKGPCDFNNHDAQNSGDSRGTGSSPRGFFVTGEISAPAVPLAREAYRHMIALSGIETATPDGFEGNDFVDAMAIHNAWYVSGNHAGHSHGCIALDVNVYDKWADQMTGGALVYYYTKQLDQYDRTDDLVDLSQRY